MRSKNYTLICALVRKEDGRNMKGESEEKHYWEDGEWLGSNFSLCWWYWKLSGTSYRKSCEGKKKEEIDLRNT